MIIKADTFVDDITLYLQQQPDIREFGFSGLFASFAAVAGLKFL